MTTVSICADVPQDGNNYFSKASWLMVVMYGGAQ